MKNNIKLKWTIFILASIVAVFVLWTGNNEGNEPVMQNMSSSSEAFVSTESTSNTDAGSSAEEKPSMGNSSPEYEFRNDNLLEQHYEKHGIEMGFKSPEEYEAAASNVVDNPDVLHKTEKEDGDDVYYVEKTNEFVIISTDGYIRTYFNPDQGINYYNRQ